MSNDSRHIPKNSNNNKFENCSLENKFLIQNIEFFLITSDYSRLIIVFNNKQNSNITPSSFNKNMKKENNYKIERKDIKIDTHNESNSYNEFQSKVNQENYNFNKSLKNYGKGEISQTLDFSNKNLRSTFCINLKENNFNYVICLANVLRNIFSSVKPIVFIPQTESSFFNIDKANLNFLNLCKNLNEFSNGFFNKLKEFIPIDKDERLFKFVPLNRIEQKFIEIKKKKILFITNKRIIELDEENLELRNLNFILISKFEVINVFPNKNLFEFIHSNNNSVVYSSLLFLNIVKLIKDLYNNSCLVPLKIKKKI